MATPLPSIILGILTNGKDGCRAAALRLLVYRHRAAAVPESGGNCPGPAMSSRAHLPLVYSCSGCSSAAQMANWLAVALDRRGLAEMSCIAGVGGDVPKLVRVATSGRPIIGI